MSIISRGVIIYTACGCAYYLPLPAIACDDRFPFTCEAIVAAEAPTAAEAIRKLNSKPFAVPPAAKGSPKLRIGLQTPTPRPRPHTGSYAETDGQDAPRIPDIGRADTDEGSASVSVVQSAFSEVARFTVPSLERALRLKGHQILRQAFRAKKGDGIDSRQHNDGDNY